jgi:Tfp pilus assembly protein PilE
VRRLEAQRRGDRRRSPRAKARTALAEALSILEKLEQEQKLAAAQKDWPNMIRTALSKRP